MKRDLVRDWMLPGAIVLGISSYLAYRFTPALHPWGHWMHLAASEGQRLDIALLLFFQFVKISPHDLRWSKWHFAALGFQTGGFLLFAFLSRAAGGDSARILLECAMICLICPTASAAGVITEKLGGNLPSTVSYLIMVNVVATFLIPTVIPLVRPAQDIGFWSYVARIAWKIFPVLVLPSLAAWFIRYTTHRLQRRLMRLSQYAFYIWGVGLFLAMALSTRALVVSGLGWAAVSGIVGVSMAVCALQFAAGRRFGRRSGEAVTSGQALGQKNTGFLIWLGYNYLTPVTSVAGGLYAVWQNLFNSWELHQAGKRR